MAAIEDPIYTVFENADNITGAFTGKGTSRENYYFSFQRSAIEHSVLFENLARFGVRKKFDPSTLTWPNGPWPHSGLAIVAEEHDWERSSCGGIVPISRVTKEAVAYDGIATRSPDYVLGVQGADCPSLFIYDPVAKVIGLSHSGWKPTVRGIVHNIISCMERLGAVSRNMIAYLSPGVNDLYNEFQWDSAMEPGVREVFVVAGRKDLLQDRTIRHQMTDTELETVQAVTGRQTRGGVSFMLSSLIKQDLEREGVLPKNIEISGHSTICQMADDGSHFLYHSARRDSGKDPERPGFGSNLCILYLNTQNHVL